MSVFTAVMAQGYKHVWYLEYYIVENGNDNGSGNQVQPGL